jgi:hypothetical protein
MTFAKTCAPGFDAFLDGDLGKARELLAPFRQYDLTAQEYFVPLLTSEGTFTPICAETFCAGYPLNKAWISLLQLVHDGQTQCIESLKLDILKRALLVGHDGQLTQRGRMKLTASLSLKQQVEILPVTYDEVRASQTLGPKTEQYVLEKYRNLGYVCQHDEGASFVMLQKMSWLNEIPTLKQYLSHDPLARDTSSFCVSTGYITFSNDARDGMPQVSGEIKSVFENILSKTTRERIIKGWQLYIAEQTALGMRPLSNELLDFYLLLFDTLGVEKLIELARFLMENTNRWGGWPDVTAIRGKEVVLIEAKRTDRILFHQARLLEEISYFRPRIFADVRVEKVVFIP